MRTEEKSTVRDAGNWAKPVDKLSVSEMPEEAVSRNVEGRRAVGPIQGFGKMWQKTYRVKLVGAAVTPGEVIETWKENFADFWPESNSFYAPLTGIKPGEVGLLKVSVSGKLKLSTGVLVMYADEESFTFMTPQGHMFAGWITFSAHAEDGVTVAQAQVLMRAQDPLTEVGLALGGHRKEDEFWQQTLHALGEHLGVDAEPETSVVCVDGKRQWSRAGNVWHSAAIRSGFQVAGVPLRMVPRPRRRKTTGTD